MGPGCCGLPADNRVPEGGLADGGWGALLFRSRRQKAQAGELVSQSHPEKTHIKHMTVFAPFSCVRWQWLTIQSCTLLPVFVVYDGINEWVVDGRGLCYDCWHGLRVRGQDVSVPGWGTDRSKEFTACFLLVYLASEHKFTGCCFLPKGRGLTKMCQLRQSVCFFFFNLLKDSFF